MRGALAGQRLLLIAPRFFGYEGEIRAEFERRGADVDFILDRPFESASMKAGARFAPGFVAPIAERYYLRALEELGRTTYDIVLIVNGQTVSEKTIRMLRRTYPTAQFILYMWDSASNRSSSVASANLFDRALTFDPHDARIHGLEFRPLFHGSGYSGASSPHTDWALSFIGTIHTDRYAVISAVLRQLPPEQRAWTYLYLQARWVFYAQKLINPYFRSATMDEFSFAPLPQTDVQDIFRRSRAILDVEHPRQRGLTIRTLEAFGSRKKLITTNAEVRDYDFYTPENIHIIDRRNPVVPPGFFESPYAPVAADLYDRYSVAGWADEVAPGSGS